MPDRIGTSLASRSESFSRAVGPKSKSRPVGGEGTFCRPYIPTRQTGGGAFDAFSAIAFAARRPRVLGTAADRVDGCLLNEQQVLPGVGTAECSPAATERTTTSVDSGDS